MISGTFVQGGFVPALKRIVQASPSGKLVCAGPGGRRSFTLSRGVVINFTSSDPADDLADFLLRRGLLSKEEHAVIALRRREGRDPQELILRAQILEEDVLQRELALRVRDAFIDCGRWVEGTFELSVDPSTLYAAENFRLSLESCLLDVLRDPGGSNAALPPEIGSPAAPPLVATSDWQERAGRIPISRQEAFILSRLTMPTRFTEILGVVPFSREEVLAALRVLVTLDLVSVGEVKPAEASTQPAAQSAAPAVPPAKAIPDAASAARWQRVQELLSGLSGADHYQVLGITKQAGPEEIKSAYHALARQYHPDRFSSYQEDVELRQAIDLLFGKIRGAYETLRDPRSRSAYDRAGDVTESTDKPTEKGARPEELEKLAEANFRVGAQCFQQQDFYKAVQQFKEAVRLQPEVAKYRNALGRALMRNPRWRKEAEDHLKQAIELDSFSADYRVSLGLLYQEVGLPKKAEALFREALAWDSENQTALRELSKLAAVRKSGSSLLRRLFGLPGDKGKKN